MSSRWNRLGCIAPVVLAGAALVLGGCVANDISLTVDEFLAPDTAMAATNVCEFDLTSVAISRGVYDATLGLALTSGYTADFSVTNNLEEVTTQNIEMQAYYITSFDVEIIPVTDSSHMAIPPSARAYSYDVASQRLAPGETGFFSVQAISADEGKNFITAGAGSIEVRVRPVATRAEEEQRGAFASFPVDICLGCLTGGTDYPDCANVSPTATPLIGNVCNYAQDEPVTCCKQGSATICGNNVLRAAGT